MWIKTEMSFSFCVGICYCPKKYVEKRIVAISMSEDFPKKELTSLIIKSFYKVYNTLGYGFLEKVYENSMILELKNSDLKITSQAPIHVYYRDEKVGNFYADLLIENFVIVEIKSVKRLTAEHDAQLLNYLKATKIEIGLLLNFGPKPEIKRRIFDNSRK